HCMEGALAAAFILQHHGYPPLLLDLSSSDGLDHVCFLYRGPRGWGTVSQSRYPGLRGRAPVFRSVRDLAWSYGEPFVDATGAVRGYATFDLRALGGFDWALSRRNVWRVERALFANRHAPMRPASCRGSPWSSRDRRAPRYLMDAPRGGSKHGDVHLPHGSRGPPGGAWRVPGLRHGARAARAHERGDAGREQGAPRDDAP